MNYRITLIVFAIWALGTTQACRAADDWPQIFDGTKGNEYVFLMLNENGSAVYLQRLKRPDGSVWLFYDDDAKWKRTENPDIHPNLSVATKRFRFDYILEKDRVTEWNKTGAQRILQKQQNRVIHD